MSSHTVFKKALLALTKLDNMNLKPNMRPYLVFLKLRIHGRQLTSDVKIPWKL